VDTFQCRYYDSDEDDVITKDVIPPRLMKYGAVTRVNSNDGNSICRKRYYFLRVVMRHEKIEEELNIGYSNNEEVFIDYDFN
jgi:hypothetical protein